VGEDGGGTRWCVFFQAEDGIRGFHVTGVQTCALPISFTRMTTGGIFRMTQKVVVAALYKFVSLPDYVALREPLLNVLEANGIKGTLLLAEEGINGTVAGSREGIDALLAWFGTDPRLADIDHKESRCAEPPFYRTKVKLKKEIVTLGVPGVDPNQRVGTYVEPKDWNALIDDPEVLLIDTRNDYEVAIGTFEGAIDPQTKSFREFPEY